MSENQTKWINKFHLGHASDLLSQMPSESVNCIVTSPPYWGLRDYGTESVVWDGDKDCKHEWGNKTIKPLNLQAGNPEFKRNWREQASNNNSSNGQFCRKCGAWRGSLGLEPTFELYIKHLCNIFDEVKRVLRKDGTCWVNIGDSYSGGGRGWQGKNNYKELNNRGVKSIKTDISNKSLMLIPQRFTIEMVNRGWILRNTIIWHKPNCIPSSVKDRFTADFEYVYFFVKNNKALFWTNEKTLEYVSKKPLGIKGVEGKDWEWRETQNWREEENNGYKMGAIDPHRAASVGGLKLREHKKGGKFRRVSLWSGHNYWFEQQFEEYTKSLNRWGGSFLKANSKSDWDKGTGQLIYRTRDMRPNNNGRNKRAVWTIPTKPFPEAHFATFPEELIEIPIKAGCPEFVCKKCGKPKVKVFKIQNIDLSNRPTNNEKLAKVHNINTSTLRAEKRIKEIGYTDCGCNAGFEGGIILDPFMGAGTTAVVALKQNKRFIGLEIKQEYIDIARKRIAKIQPKFF